MVHSNTPFQFLVCIFQMRSTSLGGTSQWEQFQCSKGTFVAIGVGELSWGIARSVRRRIEFPMFIKLQSEHSFRSMLNFLMTAALVQPRNALAIAEIVAGAALIAARRSAITKHWDSAGSGSCSASRKARAERAWTHVNGPMVFDASSIHFGRRSHRH
jgi:hypothetical protein